MSPTSDRGFTLVEVLVALVLVAAAAFVAAGVATRSLRVAMELRQLTQTTVAAVQRVEQLRALTWAVDAAGLFITDFQTKLDDSLPGPGGSGLATSPPGTLDASVSPFADYLDGQGQFAGSGATVPADGVVVRRWAVSALPGGGGQTLVLRVLAMPRLGSNSRVGTAPRVLLLADTPITEIRTRVLR